MYALQCKKTGHKLGPALDDDGTKSFLCWPTLEQAEQGKKFQQEQYGIEEYEIVKLAEEPKRGPCGMRYHADDCTCGGAAGER